MRKPILNKNQIALKYELNPKKFFQRRKIERLFKEQFKRDYLMPYTIYQAR